MRLIDADAMEKDLREQFERVFTQAGRKVKPEDYYIERRETYLADMRKVEYDSFFEYLKARPAITHESLVKRGRWVEEPCNHKPYRVKNLDKWVVLRCSECGHSNGRKKSNFCGNCGAKMVED